MASMKMRAAPKPRLGKWNYQPQYQLEFFTFYCLSANVHQTEATWTVRRGTSNVIVEHGRGENLQDAKRKALQCMIAEWDRMGSTLKQMDITQGARLIRTKKFNPETGDYERWKFGR